MLRHNLSVGAAVGIPLGLNTNDRERNASQSVQWGLSGASLTLEPFAGRLTFDKKLTNGTGTTTGRHDRWSQKKYNGASRSGARRTARRH